VTDLDTTTWLCGPPSSQGQMQQFPSRFIFNFKKVYGPLDEAKVLQMFSGSSDIGDTTDLRPETNADFIGPFDDLPIPDNTYDMVLADPPYTAAWSSEWTTLPAHHPKPKHVLREAVRMAKPEGLVAILHIIIIPAYKEFGVERIALHPILTGPNNAIRVLNVFRCPGAGVGEETL